MYKQWCKKLQKIEAEQRNLSDGMQGESVMRKILNIIKKSMKKLKIYCEILDFGNTDFQAPHNLVYSGEDLLVVSLVVSLLEEDEVVLEHDVLAEHHRQELVVGDVLVDGRNNVSRFLQHEEQDCDSEINLFLSHLHRNPQLK